MSLHQSPSSCHANTLCCTGCFCRALQTSSWASTTVPKLVSKDSSGQQIQPVSKLHIQCAIAICMSHGTNQVWLMWLPVFIPSLVLFAHPSSVIVWVTVWLMHSLISWSNHHQCLPWIAYVEWICWFMFDRLIAFEWLFKQMDDWCLAVQVTSFHWLTGFHWLTDCLLTGLTYSLLIACSSLRVWLTTFPFWSQVPSLHQPNFGEAGHLNIWEEGQASLPQGV